jgi:hypothetical protein
MVRHQVEERERPHSELLVEHEFLDAEDDGWQLHRERRTVVSAGTYSARYVTAEDLKAGTAKYRRCRICAPDAPSWDATSPKPISVSARNLGSHHIGREVEGGGVIEGIRIVVETTAGDVELSLDEALLLMPRRRP